ncbi:MAG: SDR family oxidoreductase [Bacteroidales bacterium]|nr:SDR family oxidoreductase [Bacteroidales bacterium]
MKIILFGATGLTGREILKQALDHGHEVIAIVRNPNLIEFKHSNLTINEGDVLKMQTFEDALTGCDVVISAIGTGTSFSKARKPTTLYSDGFKNIITAMRKHRISRFVALLSVGTIPDPNEAFIHKTMIRPMLKGTYDDMRRAESFLAKCDDIDWIGIRPLRLNNKPRTGKYRTGIDILPPKGVNISRADVAELMLIQMISEKYIHKYITIAD